MSRRLAGACAALAVLAAALCARSLSLSAHHLVPVYDEVAYLAQARDAAARGGPLAAAACYARGDCREDNRHPLYALALAPWMTGGVGDFPRAKLATLAGVLLLLLAMFVLGREVWGEPAALLACAALALSWNVAFLSQRVLADGLFAALYFSALAALCGWGDRAGGWLAFGLLAGLAYLAKASGELLLLGGAAAALAQGGGLERAGKRLALAAAGFCAGGGLLLWRNARLWGNPFHNANDKMLWLDSWPQMWRLSASPLWARVGPLWYLRGHTLEQAASRWGSGAAAVLGQLVEVCGAGPAPTRRLVGTVLAAACAAGWARRWRLGRRRECAAVLGCAAASLAALAWYAPVSSGERFLLPVAASLLPAAAWALPERARRWAAPAALAAGAAAAAFSLAGLARDPLSLWALPENWASTSAFLRAHAAPAGFALPYESVFSTWDAGPDLRRPYVFDAPAVSNAELEGFLERAGVQAVVLDRDAASFASQAARERGADRFGPASFLGRPRCFHDALVPSRFLVFMRRCPSS